MIQMNKTGMQTQNDEEMKKKEEKKEHEEPSKKPIHPVALVFYMISLLLISTTEYVSVKAEDIEPLQYVTICLSFLTFIILSCLMAKTKTELVCMYFLIDNILYAFTLGAIGTIGFSYVIAKEYGSQIDLTPIYVVSGISVVVLFMGIGTFRLLILNGEWKQYQVVLMKICFLISSVLYITLAFDLIVNNWASSALKDFIFIYLFGLVATILQLYGKLTDVDGTAELRYDYSIKKGPKDDEEENLPSVEQAENVQINQTTVPQKMEGGIQIDFQI